jgi:hypothetical protein
MGTKHHKYLKRSSPYFNFYSMDIEAYKENCKTCNILRSKCNRDNQAVYNCMLVNSDYN